ncbi:MAG: cobyrinate a,c-diamide synthase [Thermodesulfovibrionales bacterium]|nr:cobyrinate a,c-diamide synthase [Thermodesulfovibrionales bacterium]
MRNTLEKKASSSKKALRITIPRVVIAGLKGGSGKTTLSIGLISAIRQKGIAVAPFKKGPDYIDAGWLASASGIPCYNLDPFLIGEERALSSFISRTGGACPLAIIEGNRGLYDGMDIEGTYSTAALSKLLKSPVVLIMDCTKMTRTAAAIVLGVKRFDPDVRLRGVILNQVAGSRHESVVRDSIERHCGIPVIGAIPRLTDAAFPERHMGLTPHQEHPKVDEAISKTREIIKRYVNVDAVLGIAAEAEPLLIRKKAMPQAAVMSSLRVGVIKDSAFQFYYPENFEELQRRGAVLIEVSALKDRTLPEMDALYIGGGFPETHAIALAKNARFKKALSKAVEGGLPVYAECGGLMYLGESLTVRGRTYPMAGVLPVSFSLEEKPQAHGYTIVEVRRANPFYNKGTVLRGHEFHYSRVSAAGKRRGVFMAFNMKRGTGIRDKADGLCYKNVFATYTHLHALGAPEWADGMLRAAEGFRGRCPRQ